MFRTLGLRHLLVIGYHCQVLVDLDHTNLRPPGVGHLDQERPAALRAQVSQDQEIQTPRLLPDHRFLPAHRSESSLSTSSLCPSPRSHSQIPSTISSAVEMKSHHHYVSPPPSEQYGVDHKESHDDDHLLAGTSRRRVDEESKHLTHTTSPAKRNYGRVNLFFGLFK
jgi:hypothetical protein